MGLFIPGPKVRLHSVAPGMQGQSQQKLGWLWSIYLLFLKLPHASP